MVREKKKKKSAKRSGARSHKLVDSPGLREPDPQRYDDTRAGYGAFLHTYVAWRMQTQEKVWPHDVLDWLKAGEKSWQKRGNGPNLNRVPDAPAIPFSQEDIDLRGKS